MNTSDLGDGFPWPTAHQFSTHSDSKQQDTGVWTPSQAPSLPVGQESYEWVGEELDSGFGGKQQPNLHILIQKVFVFTGTVRRDSRVGDSVLCGGSLVRLPSWKAPSDIPGEQGRVVIVREDAVEAFGAGGCECWPGGLDFRSIFLMLNAVQVAGNDGNWEQGQGEKRYLRTFSDKSH